MKKIIIIASFALLYSGAGMAGEADLFSYDQAAVQTEMATLISLEEYVIANPGVRLGDLLTSESELVADIAKTNGFFGLESMNEKVLGIGGFWWGCCLGPVGVLVVWLGADDSAETRSSIIGCIVSTLLGSGSGLIWNLQLN